MIILPTENQKDLKVDVLVGIHDASVVDLVKRAQSESVNVQAIDLSGLSFLHYQYIIDNNVQNLESYQGCRSVSVFKPMDSFLNHFVLCLHKQTVSH